MKDEVFIMIEGWTQKHDFSATDYDDLDLAGAIRLVHEFDWSGECQLFGQRLQEKDEACMPGVGFNRKDGGIFHLYAERTSDWELCIELPRSGKFLGIFPKSAKEYTREVYSMDEAEALLQLFFAAEDGELRDHMGR